MIVNYFKNRSIRLTPKGERWANTAETIVLLSGLLLAYGIVGSVESGRWFG